MLLNVEGLAKKYGNRQVVDGVSFDVDAGQIVGLLGPNGAGKTTSFRMTCGMVTPDRGRVLLDGKDVTQWPMHQRAREGGLGYLPQQSSVFGKLTVEQNLVATMQLLGRPARQRRQETEQLLQEFGLVPIRNTNSAQVSGGERRRLEIARCLISRPKMIMLDEPFAGIDPVTVQSIQDIIRQLAARGLGILITDHAAREILQITERTYVIAEGKVLCSGTPQEVAAHPEVRQKYLGNIESFEITTAGNPGTGYIAAGGHVEMPPAKTAPQPIARAEQPVAPRRDEPTRDEPTRADAPAVAAAPRPKMTTFTFQPLEEAAEPAAIADSAQSAAAAGSTRRAVPARSFFPQPRPIGRDQ
jgi:lipopolysaccharide export system ATP-binding protein